jgi:hypothetical protein
MASISEITISDNDVGSGTIQLATARTIAMMIDKCFIAVGV